MHRTHLPARDIILSLLLFFLILIPSQTTAYDPQTLASQFKFDFESITNFAHGNSSVNLVSVAHRGTRIESLLVRASQFLGKKQEEECPVGTRESVLCPIADDVADSFLSRPMFFTLLLSFRIRLCTFTSFHLSLQPSANAALLVVWFTADSMLLQSSLVPWSRRISLLPRGLQYMCKLPSFVLGTIQVAKHAVSHQPGAAKRPRTANPCCLDGESCCGDICCPSGEFCERNECLDVALKNKVARFEYDEKKNGDLLRNMCNGLRGKNTQELTYSGPASDPDKAIARQLKNAKAKKRRNAGCIRNLCKQAKWNNGNPLLNSCDEVYRAIMIIFPPASSDEGGGTTLLQVVACVNEAQQDYQGGIMSGVTRKLVKGDKFVISVDCDKVLGSITPPRAVSAAEESLGDPVDKFSAPLTGIEKRDTVSEASNGTVSFFMSAQEMELNTTAYGYFIAPFGDLWAGTYTATVHCTSGSSFGGFMIDNTGDNITDSTDSGTSAVFSIPPLKSGQNATLSFTLEYPFGGVGILIGVHGNTTKNGGSFTWSLQGTTWDNVTDASLDDNGASGSTTSGISTAGGSSATGKSGSSNGSGMLEFAPLGMLIGLVSASLFIL
ncbi:hypothetical protein GGX14DRAFT_546292 [Mycena pura]|uniref:Deoxyribonuclease NucA/NucB domain-containing protein n=1 Tax=Mycena pura TaxID=153505 RepID=A0AAD6UWA9_9AGAR|nr:hypothetical protein GGX14DRAFT_546292 [Mycena pura]